MKLIYLKLFLYTYSTPGGSTLLCGCKILYELRLFKSSFWRFLEIERRIGDEDSISSAVGDFAPSGRSLSIWYKTWSGWSDRKPLKIENRVNVNCQEEKISVRLIDG